MEVAIGPVVRGNPYVTRNATAAGLPRSVPPTKTYEVRVTLSRPLQGNNRIELDISGRSADNGTATVAPAQITRTSTVTVTGGIQTEPGHAGNLHIRARLNGQVEKATSLGFSVCAHPKEVQNGPYFDSLLHDEVGMTIVITVKSDSDNDDHLAEVQESEQVRFCQNLEGCFEGRPLPGEASGFQVASRVPPDHHIASKSYMMELVGRHGNGTFENHQVDIFYCKRCGMTVGDAVVVPNSGYCIKHELTRRPFGKRGLNRVRFKTTKSPMFMNVNAYESRAGPSGPYSRSMVLW